MCLNGNADMFFVKDDNLKILVNNFGRSNWKTIAFFMPVSTQHRKKMTWGSAWVANKCWLLNLYVKGTNGCPMQASVAKTLGSRFVTKCVVQRRGREGYFLLFSATALISILLENVYRFMCYNVFPLGRWLTWWTNTVQETGLLLPDTWKGGQQNSVASIGRTTWIQWWEKVAGAQKKTSSSTKLIPSWETDGLRLPNYYQEGRFAVHIYVCFRPSKNCMKLDC